MNDNIAKDLIEAKSRLLKAVDRMPGDKKVTSGQRRKYLLT